MVSGGSVEWRFQVLEGDEKGSGRQQESLPMKIKTMRPCGRIPAEVKAIEKIEDI